ncbi:MAG: hypothetical protein AMXMBFR53_39310 [Gemmatimonadota bacterium]
MDPRYQPQDIAPTEDAARLRIRWHDGEVSEFDPFLLRTRCPCAGCVDEMTGIRTLRPEAVPRDIYPEAIHYVGRYALQFLWSDGHTTGIYPYELLRRLWDELQEGGADA